MNISNISWVTSTIASISFFTSHSWRLQFQHFVLNHLYIFIMSLSLTQSSGWAAEPDVILSCCRETKCWVCLKMNHLHWETCSGRRGVLAPGQLLWNVRVRLSARLQVLWGCGLLLSSHCWFYLLKLHLYLIYLFPFNYTFLMVSY